MSSARARGGAAGRRSRGGGEAHENEERWLLTYSDMITLLMALFIVMWAISSVNISKFDQLKAALKSAFSAKVLPTNSSILSGEQSPFQMNGAPIQPLNETNSPSNSMSNTSSSAQSVVQVKSLKQRISQNITASLALKAGQQDMDNLLQIQQEIQDYAKAHGLQNLVKTRIDQRGLVVHLLTDKVLFGSGEAQLKPAALPLLGEIAQLLSASDIVNPVAVEGNTDDVAIHSSQYPSNWELSSARADAVLEFLLEHGVAPKRLSATGFGEVNPLASNATDAGRAANRRVDLVILRRSFG